MSEPVKRHTQAAEAQGLTVAAALRIHSPLAKALSLCSVLSMVLLAGAPTLVQADEPIKVQSVESAKAQHTLLLDVARAGERLVSVGDRGHILYSDDNGETWTQARVPSKQLLTALFFIDDKQGWAVGHDAQILATHDAGSTWTLQYQNLDLEAPLLDVWFQNPEHGIAVGAYGALLETTDGGANWEDISERMDNEDSYHLNAIAEVKGSGLVVVGEQGAIFRSGDWGETWEQLESPYEGSLFGAVATGEPGGLVAYGLRGHLFHSTDFGNSWQRVNLTTASNSSLDFGLSNGALLSDGSIVIVGHGGSVLRSTDQGRSFTVANRPDRLSLAGVISDSNGRLILVGQGGVHLAASTDTSRGQQ